MINIDEQLLIVVPALNEEDHIANIIHFIRADNVGRNAQIVVADGGSQDKTANIVRELASKDMKLHLINVWPHGIPGGVNLAVQTFADKHKWLLRLDVHAVYPKGFIFDLLAEAEAMQADQVVVRLKSIGGTCFQTALATAQNSKLGSGGAPHRSGREGQWALHGHHALFKLEWFQRLNGYNECFDNKKGFSAEDVDFDFRLRKSGGRLWLTNAHEVLYVPRKSALALFSQYYGYGGGRALFFIQHPDGIEARHLILPLVAPCALGITALPVFWPVAVPGIAWSFICVIYGIMLAVKTRSACAAVSGLCAMTMHLGWSVGFWSKLFARRV